MTWFRLIGVCSKQPVLFGITALILASVYFALSQTIPASPARRGHGDTWHPELGRPVGYRTDEQFQAADLASVQKAVNFTALQTLRDYSIIALVIMFGLSLLIGWWVAGRALRPVAFDQRHCARDHRHRSLAPDRDQRAEG